MGKRRHRRKKTSLEARVREHQEKVKKERQKETPDKGLIRHWEKEIRVFQSAIRKVQKRLGERK